MDTVQKINEMLTKLGMLYAMKRKPKRKNVKKIIALLGQARESIWQLEEIIMELEADVQNLKCAVLNRDKQTKKDEK